MNASIFEAFRTFKLLRIGLKQFSIKYAMLEILINIFFIYIFVK